MPQLALPGFPEGTSPINATVSVLRRGGRRVWLAWGIEIFAHPEDDRGSFKVIVSALMRGGLVRASEFEKSEFRIAHRTLMNWGKLYDAQGSRAFFRGIRPQCGGAVMTEAKVAECRRLLDDGLAVAEAARRAGVGDSTLRKALRRGAIQRTAPPSPQRSVFTENPESTKTARTHQDAEATMGTGCTRPEERMAAAVGLAGAAVRFERCADVHLGGVLVGLPALAANGLFSGLSRYLHLPKGFYSAMSILMTIGFMALARIKRPEGLRHQAPGELGKVIGLDRVPEARTLRAKIAYMAENGDPLAWMLEQTKAWMEADPQEAGYLYVDGHVRVYHGQKARLPRRYVARQRLCLRGTTDYWVNDALGRPFLVISKSVTDGLAATLTDELLPRLLATVPGQPTAAQLAADPTLPRFIVVFDREGATHALLSKLWEQRVAAITYRKAVKDIWPESEFVETDVPIPGGGMTSMRLATRQTELRAGSASMPVTEIRKLGASGHQTAIITTARQLASPIVAGRMFSRWCQENYFAYMMQHFDLDGLVQYGHEDVLGTLQVVNPAWRHLEKEIKETRRKRLVLEAEMGRINLENNSDVQQRAERHQAIQEVELQLNALYKKRKKLQRKIPVGELPENERPNQLVPLRKTLTDTVKMIAYRAETALVSLLRPHLNKEEEARALIREIFASSADLIPNETSKTLTVRIHRMACPAHDQAVAALLKDLTDTEYKHPQTQAKMVFELA